MSNIETSEKFADKYRIKSGRLVNWDYSSSGYYFITICTYNRNNFFGQIIDGQINLSEQGKIAKDELLKTFAIRKNIFLDEYVIMPNHIHLLIKIPIDSVETHCMRLNPQTQTTNFNPQTQTTNKINFNQNIKRDAYNASLQQIALKSAQTIPKIIKLFKASVKSKSNNQKLWFSWQSRFYDQIIRSETELNNIRQYIKNNPKNFFSL